MEETQKPSCNSRTGVIVRLNLSASHEPSFFDFLLLLDFLDSLDGDCFRAAAAIDRARNLDELAYVRKQL